MPVGLTLGTPPSPLAERAADFLAAGPADAQSLIAHVCQLPGAPLHVAEHMAAALFAGHSRFVRDPAGRWLLRCQSAGPRWAVLEETSLDSASFVVVDVETTGTRPLGGDRITEIAAVRVQNGTATTVFDSLINPERSIPPAIVAITNITWEMVKDAPRFADVCDQLLGTLEGHVFVAHNAGFDWGFVSMEVARAVRRPLEGRSLCTVRLSRKLLPQLRRRTLDSVAGYFGIEIGRRHRAGGDALATAHVLLRLIDHARDRGCSTVADLDALMREPSPRHRRPRRPPALPHAVSNDTTA